MFKNIITIDFETKPIEKRPDYPPEPVGVAIKDGNKKAVYYAWAHPTENNCTLKEAKKILKKYWDSDRPLLFHNAKFDIDVAETHLGMKRLSWDKYHDTLPMLFLLDPRAKTYSLKPSAERYLNLKPEEQDAVNDWLIYHQPVENIKLTRNPKSKGLNTKYAGAYICLAPGKLVGSYACGDVFRTYRLFKYSYNKLKKRKMLAAYEREIKFMLVTMQMEVDGIRLYTNKLKCDYKKYKLELEKVDNWIRRKLKAKDLNIDSGPQLVEAMLKVNMADKELLGYTTTGKVQANKIALEEGITNKQLLSMLQFRSSLNNSFNTFLSPWYRSAITNKGLFYTQWNSTRHDDASKKSGAKTGRISSSPNLQNVTKKTPPKPPKGFVKLPLLRGYIIPYERDHVLICRDFASQELRVLAHFEDDDMLEAYQKNPDLDLHQYAIEIVEQKTGRKLERKDIKTIAFAILYGSGIGHLAEMLDVSIQEAKSIKSAYLDTFPGISSLIQSLRVRAKSEEPIRTWGGREYFVEPSIWKQGRLWDFSYKLINYLIQGSSADLTKEAVIDFNNIKDKKTKILLTVHDEILASTPKSIWKSEMQKLKDCMNKDRLDVPMRSTGKVGKNWVEMKGCE